MSGKLTEDFRELIELRWSEFVAREQNQQGTNFDAIVTALARACAKGDLRAIQTALDRMDGKIATEIEVEYPKFYMTFPNAKEVAGGDVKSLPDTKVTNDHGKLTFPATDGVTAISDKPNVIPEDDELPTGSLRAVLDRMLNSPKQIVVDILATAKMVDEGMMDKGDPLVKSVIVAGLMSLVHKGQMSAVFEVFEQVDGKIAEKYKLLGDDVYIQNYATIAPAGAVKNENGVYQIAADNTTNAWAARLEIDNGRKKNR